MAYKLRLYGNPKRKLSRAKRQEIVDVCKLRYWREMGCRRCIYWKNKGCSVEDVLDRFRRGVLFDDEAEDDTLNSEINKLQT